MCNKIFISESILIHCIISGCQSKYVYLDDDEKCTLQCVNEELVSPHCKAHLSSNDLFIQYGDRPI